MNSKVDIKGDVGVAIGQNHGPVTINNTYLGGTGGGGGDEPPIDSALNRAIHILLRTCDPVRQRDLIQNIAEEYYGTTNFKSLDIEQVRVLTGFAKDIADAINQARLDEQNADIKDESAFYKETKMRASAPARTALRLLLKENVTTVVVARAWRNGQLTYEDNNQLTVKINKLQHWLGNILLGMGILFVMPAFFANLIMNQVLNIPPGAHIADRITLIVLSLTVGISTLVMSMSFLSPHYAASKISKLIDRVNSQLKGMYTKD